ncbi:hypothetical protein P4H27_26155 [Paenibacillus taichungensis]|nr:hypothetical protein [Paenibacillus taichungensis]MEC0110458.1 hypothetical protein [Paenibacillus taichungensis]
MEMQVRIKASENFNDVLAMKMAGGRLVEGKHPKFVFSGQAQRDDYDRIRREMKGANEDGSTAKGNPEARTASRKYRSSREFRI